MSGARADRGWCGQDGQMHDDLGAEVPLTKPARRVVSLVPSLTEALVLSAPHVLVGATTWCTQPAELDVPRVRGTKNPDLRAIVALRPDLVVANQEENRRVDVERLRAAGVPVWVTRIDSIAESLASMERLLELGLGLARPPEWLVAARRVWDVPPRPDGPSVAVPVWRDPWLWVGSQTYADDVLARSGLRNAAAAFADRYPRAAPTDLLAQQPDLVLLPDEPYPFSPSDGPEALAPARCVSIPGRALFWYGPAMLAARDQLESAAFA